MRAMKLPQFTTKTLLLITAVAAITCGGIFGFNAILPERIPLGIFVMELLAVVPLWWPYAFIGFAIGRKRLSVAMVITFAVTEAIALAITYGIVVATTVR
jgi:hypothetical protein